MPRGIPGSGKPKAKVVAGGANCQVDVEMGRRQIFSLAVKWGLTADDLERMGEQLDYLSRLKSEWRKAESGVMAELLKRRNGESLVEVAELASAEAWRVVAREFAQRVPGWRAELVKGEVRVREVPLLDPRDDMGAGGEEEEGREA